MYVVFIQHVAMYTVMSVYILVHQYHVVTRAVRYTVFITLFVCVYVNNSLCIYPGKVCSLLTCQGHGITPPQNPGNVSHTEAC